MHAPSKISAAALRAAASATGSTDGVSAKTPMLRAEHHF
jgi:hypothetical protein